MNTERRLELEVLTTKWGIKLLRITKQTHKENRFSPLSDNKESFIASNGFVITSRIQPQIDNKFYCLYVRGMRFDFNDEILIVPDEDWLNKCRIAVKEYNEKYSNKLTIDCNNIEIIN